MPPWPGRNVFHAQLIMEVMAEVSSIEMAVAWQHHLGLHHKSSNPTARFDLRDQTRCDQTAFRTETRLPFLWPC